MRKAFSRLASVEERKNTKTAVFFIFLTIVALIVLFFEGLPFLGNFAVFVSEIGKSTKPIVSTDKTPPAPPKFASFPDFTNQNKIDLKGNTEPGAIVKLTFNGSEQDGLSDKDGKFTFSMTLTNGENDFSAIAVDQAGNISQKTQDYKIVFDNKPPTLTIDSPANGAQFLGSKERQVTIQGTTDPNTQITVNDRIVAVDDSGKFQYTTTLTDGENKFAVKSTDQAGNTAEADLTLNFTS
jgi:hypothetical protein